MIRRTRWVTAAAMVGMVGMVVLAAVGAPEAAPVSEGKAPKAPQAAPPAMAPATTPAESTPPGGCDPASGCCPAEVKTAPDHFIPVDKKLDPKWMAALTAKGERTWYAGDDLKTIGMPIGGIAAGQVYLTGDGRLAYWAIFNKHVNTGYGRTSYRAGRTPPTPIDQDFALRVTPEGGTSVIRSLDSRGFASVRFCGEYPIGFVQYRDKGVPVEVDLEAFSPFIPLNAPDSALPCTILQYTVRNASKKPVRVELAGRLENAVCFHTRADAPVAPVSRRLPQEIGASGISCTVQPLPQAKEPRRPVLFEDFEGKDYGKWTVEGKAFGTGPAAGTLAKQQPVSGYSGKRLVNTYLGGDDKLEGKLISPEFVIERPYLRFLIGGGDMAGKTCMNLVVGKKVVRTAAGKKAEKLLMHNWDVRDLAGKTAWLEIVDAATGPWGHINIDRIEFADTPRSVYSGPVKDRFDYGTMALALRSLAGGERTHVRLKAAVPGGRLASTLFDATGLAEAKAGADGQTAQTHAGVLAAAELKPGQKTTATFVVAWCFPNRPQHGNFYATRFKTAADVTRYVHDNYDRLAGQTRLWHKTYYDSTLPHWLLDRLNSTTSTLATNTCHWWANGRFWAWEGEGCCHGTCGHVWNYAHTPARLFPRLERSVREMQDFHPEVGFIAESGAIRFRGEGWRLWAGDSQGGYILKAYREHLMSADDKFLRRVWPRVKKAIEFLIAQDGDDDGLLAGSQHNTYDINFHGPNTMVGSLYLGALRAGEEMARELGDAKFADRCRRIAAAGMKQSVQKLFNGEYFIQDVDLAKHPKFQYAKGCLADQMFGQGWADQVGLGYLYPAETVKRTLCSIWRFNWAPDIGPQNRVHKPERWFATPGEAGLFTCTWPKTPHLPKGVRYKNEIWTGIEYQVAGHMAWEGMVTQALAICRGIHDRYHPSKRNPWNEVECGDHYARGMASWGVLLGLSGFELQGPRGHMGFAPRITPDNFRCAFTAPEGWGTISQKRTKDGQECTIEVKWGRLRGRRLALALPKDATMTDAEVTLDGEAVEGEAMQKGTRMTLAREDDLIIKAGQTLVVRVRW